VVKNPPNDVASCRGLRVNIGGLKSLVRENIWFICGITAPSPGGGEPSSEPGSAHRHRPAAAAQT